MLPTRMALKFVILALAICGVAAARVRATKGGGLTKANRQELQDRVNACAAGFPGRRAGSFDSSPQEQCVTKALNEARTKLSPQTTILKEMPECMRSAGAAGSAITNLSTCLKKNLPLPWTFVEGNTVYTRLESFVHMFAIQDCLESSKDVNKVEPIVNQTCAYELYLQYGFGASEDSAKKWLEACFNRAGVAKQKAANALKCYSNGLKDPAVLKRAQEYLDRQGL